MTLAEEYRLSEYDTLGPLEDHPRIRLVRSRITGRICVRKQVSAAQLPVYQFLQTHPNPYVPEIYACVEDGGELIILEEYLTGRNLAEILQDGVFSEPEAAAVITALCRALRPLHQAWPQIICRDLKAENVMRTEEGKIRLVDFDIARQYQPGQNRDTQLLGTAGYAAPEQFGFRQTDGRSDIYALGVLLNMLLTGQFPTEQLTAGPLQPVVLCCTELNPTDRYQRVEDLEEDLCLRLPCLPPPGGRTGTARRAYADANVPGSDRGAAAEDASAQFSRSRQFSLLLPGFRSHTPWKMFLAVVLYLLLLWFWFSLPIKADGAVLTGLHLRLEQGLLWLANVAHICIIWNWNGWRDALPLVRSRRRICRLAGYCITAVLLFLSAIFLSVIVDTWF